MKCPKCNLEPLEVEITLEQVAYGEFDEARNLGITDIAMETIRYLSCTRCNQAIPVESIKCWDYVKEAS
jgi:hypothetical protein